VMLRYIVSDISLPRYTTKISRVDFNEMKYDYTDLKQLFV